MTNELYMLTIMYRLLATTTTGGWYMEKERCYGVLLLSDDMASASPSCLGNKTKSQKFIYFFILFFFKRNDHFVYNGEFVAHDTVLDKTQQNLLISPLRLRK